MKLLMVLIFAAFLSLMSIACAISFEDIAMIQDSCKSFVDEGQVKNIDVSVQPPDEVIYNITTNAEKSILKARLVGIIAFSNLTYYHPEVTKGWIGVFIDNTEATEPIFIDIYSSDLFSIVDRRHPDQSKALTVMNRIINTRGTSNRINEHPNVSTSKSTESFTQSYSDSSTSSYSNRCDEVVHVRGYTTKKGKYVAPYDRKPPGC